jgi:Tfp pilus assembly protein PilN
MKAVNLLPSEHRVSAKTPGAAASSKPGGNAFGAYIVLGVLAFAVVAMAGYVLTTNSIKDRKAELAKITRQIEVTSAQAKSVQAFADFKSLADQRVATVTGLASSRFNWEQTLGDLSRALPADVHLKSLTGTTGTQLAGGGNSLRGAIQAPALELSGCTTTQTSVARLMSRLRDVRGVTRLTLTRSDKDNGATSISAPAPTGGTPASLCPKGSPPAFDIVVFFERAAVAAAASPNVGATAVQKATGAATSVAGSASTQTQTQTQSNAASPSQATAANGGAVPANHAASATQGVSSP